eukprot:GHVS01011640.1.p1 GENE.GHVS01011640.1~~GHVS01011640.1.p1  ORF type:complete len:263 (-),score=70.54 GHVS01011640.1:170-958(-)
MSLVHINNNSSSSDKSCLLLAVEGDDGHLYKLNNNWDTVDALSYIDPLTEDASIEARRLVQLELQDMGVVMLQTNNNTNNDNIANVSFTDNNKVNKDYLFHMNLPSTPTVDKLLLEYNSISITDNNRFVGVDMSRYNDIEPASNAASPTEWADCMKRGEMLLEYSTTGVQNLELMQMHCQKLWLKHIADVQTHETMLRREVEKLREEIEQTNKRRKLEQVSAGNDLRRLMRKREEQMERSTRVLLAKIAGLSNNNNNNMSAR